MFWVLSSKKRISYCLAKQIFLINCQKRWEVGFCLTWSPYYFCTNMFIQSLLGVQKHSANLIRNWCYCYNNMSVCADIQPTLCKHCNSATSGLIHFISNSFEPLGWYGRVHGQNSKITQQPFGSFTPNEVYWNCLGLQVCSKLAICSSGPHGIPMGLIWAPWILWTPTWPGPHSISDKMSYFKIWWSLKAMRLVV